MPKGSLVVFCKEGMINQMGFQVLSEIRSTEIYLLIEPYILDDILEDVPIVTR